MNLYIERWKIFLVDRVDSDDSDGACDASSFTISILQSAADRKLVLLHEMIHAYEVMLDDEYLREYLIIRLYRKLLHEYKIPDDEIMDYINLESHYATRVHSVVFALKSLDLDYRLGLRLGTIFGYGRSDMYETIQEREEGKNTMTLDWGDIEKAKILVIGHDPRLSKSDTIAEYCLFANYYFKEISRSKSDIRKFGLAKNTFEQIMYLTNNRYCAGDIYITNLCNISLPHAPNKKTVLIPYEFAKTGLNHIYDILNSSRIEYIFPTSLQVNYWLQELCFYGDNNKEFLEAARPKAIGLGNNPPYYDPSRQKAFQKICGSVYDSKDGKHKVIPILHPKNYPLKGSFLVYERLYSRIQEYFSSI